MEDPHNPKPHLGQLVEILRGRDRGQYMIIVGVIDARFVLIADGYKRKFSRPKKKNNRHIRYVGFANGEVVKSLNDHGKVTNAKLRYALEQFTQKNEKGE